MAMAALQAAMAAITALKQPRVVHPSEADVAMEETTPAGGEPKTPDVAEIARLKEEQVQKHKLEDEEAEAAAKQIFGDAITLEQLASFITEMSSKRQRRG